MDISQFNFIQFTEAEAKQIAPLQNIFARQTELLLSLAEKTAKAKGEAEAEYLAQMQKAHKELDAVRAELFEINKAAEERYYKSVPTEQAILDDARKVLAVATKEDYETHQTQLYTGYTALAEYLESNKDRLTDAELIRYKHIMASASEPKLDYSGYFAYLIGCTRLQLVALRYHDLPTAPLADLIREQAAGAYKPPEHQSEPLTEQQITELVNKQAPLDNAELAIDKVNVNFVNMLKDAAEGQIAFAIDTIMANPSRQEPLVTVSVDFTGLEENITRSISRYDKRVMQAINTLWENGETTTTLSRVYTAMGGKGRPAASDIEKIKNSITKQMTILLKLSNKLEREQGYKYDAVEYTGNLLLIQIMPLIKNGKAVEGAIKILGKPPLIDFAKKRGQITTIPLKMLQAPINKTERNLSIEDYIQYRVSRERTKAIDAAMQKYSKDKAAKSISIDKKMLYSTIFENADISGRMAQHRAKETIQKIFDYYVEENIKDIAACKYEADAVIVTYTFTPEQILQEKAKRKAARGSEKLLH